MQLSEKNGQTCVNCFAYTERMSLPESETLHSGRTALDVLHRQRKKYTTAQPESGSG